MTDNQSSQSIKVSVVVSTFNRAALLSEAVDSVFAQKDEIYELVIINDGSTDTTREYIDRLGNQHPEFVTAVNQENTGKADALNNAFSYVTGSHVIILDDDDLLMSGCVRQHKEAIGASETPDVFSYGPYFMFRSRDDIARRGDLTAINWGVNDDQLFIWALESYRLQQGAMLVPIEMYRAVGPYDKSLTRAQDYDVTLRLCRVYSGVPVGHYVLAVREHEGPRGPQWALHKARDRFLVWRKFDHIILRRYRATLPLNEFLGKNVDSSEKLTTQQQRSALIERGTIMARRGLFREALDDFSQAAEVSPGAIPESDLETLGRALELARYDTLPRGSSRFFLQCFGPFRKLGGDRAINLLVRRLYWSLRDRLECTNIRESFLFAGVFLVSATRAIVSRHILRAPS
jgi:GT2 family glycosyltransferase